MFFPQLFAWSKSDRADIRIPLSGMLMNRTGLRLRREAKSPY
jgi:hypothetical protein